MQKTIFENAKTKDNCYKIKKYIMVGISKLPIAKRITKRNKNIIIINFSFLYLNYIFIKSILLNF